MMKRDKADYPCNTTSDRRPEYVVRPMTVLDIERMIQLGALMHQESPTYRGLSFDIATIRKRAAVWWTHKEVYGVVIECNSEIIGMMVGLISPFFFSNERRIDDLLMYIHPQHRDRPLILRRMLRMYEEIAKRLGIRYSLLGNSAGIADARLLKFYERSGYTPLTQVLIKEL